MWPLSKAWTSWLSHGAPNINNNMNMSLNINIHVFNNMNMSLNINVFIAPTSCFINDPRVFCDQRILMSIQGNQDFVHLGSICLDITFSVILAMIQAKELRFIDSQIRVHINHTLVQTVCMSSELSYYFKNPLKFWVHPAKVGTYVPNIGSSILNLM